MVRYRVLCPDCHRKFWLLSEARGLQLTGEWIDRLMNLFRIGRWRMGGVREAWVVGRLRGTAFILAIVCFFVCGCSRPDGRALDGLLSSNRFDRVEIVD